MSHRLRMPGEVRAWLTDLRTRDLPVARLAGEAVTALLDEGDGLGPPLVVAIESALRAQDPGRAADHAYQRQLAMLQKVRRGVADVATARKRLELMIGGLEAEVRKREAQITKAAAFGMDGLSADIQSRRSALQAQLVDLYEQHAALWSEEKQVGLSSQRLQAKVDAFRSRKESVKAVYTAKQAHLAIDEALADLGEETSGTNAPDAQAEPAIIAARSAAEELLESARELESEGQEIHGEDVRDQDVVKELRLQALTGHDVRILFTMEPPDTVVLLAAESGSTSWWEWYDRTLPLAQTTPDDKPDSTTYDRQSFLDGFFPGEASERESHAAQLAARNRVRPLVEVRLRTGLTQAQVAERMNVQEERVSAIEEAEPGTNEVRTLAAYIAALGGRLELTADFGAGRTRLA